MGKFKKRPVIVEAVQWCGWNGQIVIPGVVEYDPYSESEFKTSDKNCLLCGKPSKDHGWISTLEGGHIVCFGDWIITGVEGEKYPCKPAIFDRTYERVEEKSCKPIDDMVKLVHNAFNQHDELNDHTAEIKLERVTRIEVIDEDGRSYVNWSDKNQVELSIQDTGRTLKVFITERNQK